MSEIDSYLKNNDSLLYTYRITPDIKRIAEKYGFLDYMVERYLEFLGEGTEDFLSSCSVPLTKSIRCNSLKIDCGKLEKRLTDKGFSLKRIEWSRFGYRVEKVPPRPTLGATVEYMKGFYYIQGEASMIPPEVLSPKEGELVLDMASSPGGKTTHMAQLMNNRGTIVALEKNPARLRKIRSNISRLGVSNVVLLWMGGEDVPKLGIEFDKILLDAPCSGEGLIPLDPSRKTKTKPEDLKNFQRTQLTLLASGFKVLKRGGYMVYSTCSIAPEEDEVIVDFAVKYLGMRVEKIQGIPGERGLTSFKGLSFSPELTQCLRIYPHLQHMEGIFRLPAEERVRKVNPGLLAHVLHEYGCDKIPVKLDLYEIRNVIYGTTVNPGVIDMLNGNLVEMIGVPLLLKKRTGMVPLLPLGDYMVKSCSHKVILPDKIIEKVLYGKPVIVEEVYNFRRALLVDGYNDFVAFVTLRRRNRGTEIIPVLDIGWYLRGGG